MKGARARPAASIAAVIAVAASIGECSLSTTTPTPSLPRPSIAPTVTGRTTRPATDDPAQTAAERYHWGAPIPEYSDEFDYTGPPDPAKWTVYGQADTYRGGQDCGPGNSYQGTTRGRRCAYAVTVRDGYLRETGYPNGDTGGIASAWNSRYGRYEIRARVIPAPANTGHPYHPVLLLWPENNAWPSGGEYDYVETQVGAHSVSAFMHHPTQQVLVQDAYVSAPIDLPQWHNYAFQWSPTGLAGYLDGAPWFQDTTPAAQAPGPMHQTIQLDSIDDTGHMHQASFDIAWARFYRLPAPGQT